jgi:predicted peptidase
MIMTGITGGRMQPELLPFTYRVLLLATSLLVFAGCAGVPAPQAIEATPTPTARVGQHAYTTTVQINDESHVTQTVQVNYLLYLPESYGQDPQKRWPVILFLHGRGERGDNLELLKKHPLPKILEQQSSFPAVVISPQLSLQRLWWSDMIDPLNALLDQILAEYSVDPYRVYLTGLSMGGFGAWEYILRYPTRFAAVVPIAGGYREGSRLVPENICDLKDVPIWVFHGSSDTTIPSFQSEILVEALQACGSNVRFTLYADAEHEDSFLRAYAEPELFPWLFAQTQE